nr:proline-rich protein 18 [Oryctolagus cuniculus]
MPEWCQRGRPRVRGPGAGHSSCSPADTNPLPWAGQLGEPWDAGPRARALGPLLPALGCDTAGAAPDLAGPRPRTAPAPPPAARPGAARRGVNRAAPAPARRPRLLAVPAGSGPGGAQTTGAPSSGRRGGAGTWARACEEARGAAAARRPLTTRPPGRAMPFPPRPPPPPPAPAAGGAAARLPPRRPCAPAPAPPPAPPLAAAEKKRRPPERPAALLSSSWPSATLKKPPARRGPGPGPSRTQPPAPPRAPPQASPGRAGAPATCATPRPAGTGPNAAAGAGPGPDDAVRFSLSLTPEAILVIQRRHLEKQLLARPRRSFPSPLATGPGPRRGGPAAPPAAGLACRPLPRAPLLPGGLRPVLQVSLLNERHKYDDVEYEEEAEAPDEGVVRKCTEWLRGVESAAAGRGRAAHLDAPQRLSTL